MFTVLSPSRALLVCTLASTFGGAFGCITPVGRARNPTFRDAVAPQPTLVLAPVVCRAGGSPVGDELVAQARVILRAATKTEGHALSRTEETALCGALADDADGLRGEPKEWSTGAVVRATVDALATARGTKSVVVPVIVTHLYCKQNESSVKNAKGETIATVDHGTQDCYEDGRGILRAYVFGEGGELLWKSWALLQSSKDVEGGAQSLFTGIPVDLAQVAPPKETASTDVATASPSSPTEMSAPKVSTEEFAAIVERELPKAPGECQTYAKVACQRFAELPDGAEQCTRVAKSIAALAKAQKKANQLCQQSREQLEAADAAARPKAR